MTNLVPQLANNLTSLVGAPEGVLQSLAVPGMAGVVVLLLMKFFPAIIAHLERKDKAHMDHLERKDLAHRKIIHEIVTANTVKDEAWQKIITECRTVDRSTNNTP
jgi:uncharacterized membrane protein